MKITKKKSKKKEILLVLIVFLMMTTSFIIILLTLLLFDVIHSNLYGLSKSVLTMYLGVLILILFIVLWCNRGADKKEERLRKKFIKKYKKIKVNEG